MVSDVWERVDQDQVVRNLDVWVRKVSSVWPDNIAIPTHGQEPQQTPTYSRELDYKQR